MLTLLSAFVAIAQATTGSVAVQGQLYDENDQPFSGTSPLTVTLLHDPDGDGTPEALFSETQTVGFFSGGFSVWLGGISGMNLDLLATDGPLWLSVQLPGGAPSAPVSVAWAPRAAWAARAGRATSAASADAAPWAGIDGVPASLLDGDQDTTYAAGAGVTLTGTTFAVDPGLTLPWGQITGAPATLLDGDQDTTYAAGAGIRLNGTTFSVDPALTINWSQLSGVPTDIADGDQNTAWTVGAGLTLTGTTLSASASSSSRDGATQAKAATSCETLRNDGVTTSNVYWIDPNDGATTDARQVYCDMVTDGGGWTFLGHINSDSGGGFFFTNDIGTYSTTRVDTGTIYSIAGFLAPLGHSEAMVTLDTADPPTADTANKLAFFKFPVGNPGFTTGPLPCNGLGSGFMYRINISGPYLAGGTSNSCIGSDWYTRTAGSAAYIVLFHSTGLGNYWGSGIGGNDSWNHDGWWYVR